jgi:hypothetical protein
MLPKLTERLRRAYRALILSEEHLASLAQSAREAPPPPTPPVPEPNLGPPIR